MVKQCIVVRFSAFNDLGLNSQKSKKLVEWRTKVVVLELTLASYCRPDNR